MACSALPTGFSRTAALALAVVTALLAGCAGGPRPSADRDGPGTSPPPDLQQMPDAEPRLEPIRLGGPNKPYAVLGQSYTPITTDRPYREIGLASWYGSKFHGRPTASGEIYNMYGMTAAHATLPIPSYVRVRNPANQREIIVRVNDRGPFHAGRLIDLSYTAALKLGVLNAVSRVEVTRLTDDDIRAGTWRRSPDPGQPVTAVAQASTAIAAPAGTVVTTPTPPATVPVTAAPVAVVATTSDTAADKTAAPASTAPTDPAGTLPPVVPVPGATTDPAAGRQAAAVPGAAGYWLQLGAFRDRDGAVSFQRRVVRDFESMAPMLAIFSDTSLHRLQAGPYASRQDAASAAQRVRELLQLVPVIVERR